MILADIARPPAGQEGSEAPGNRATLDALLARAAQRWPSALALIDPPDRESFTDGAPRRLTFAEADEIVAGVAGRLAALGLPPDSIVATQLPNCVESVLVLLAIMRAGMIAAPLPLLWRKADAAKALNLVGAKALIAARHVAGFDYAELAMHVAVETFTIRFVLGFGPNLHDGVVPLDDLLTPRSRQTPAIERAGNPANHVAIVTFEVTADGLVAVARSHNELIVAGLALGLESRIEGQARILGAMMTSSFVGLAATVLPWLIFGGTLVLHHPFHPMVYGAQRTQLNCDIVVLPGPLVPRLAEAGIFTGGVKSIVAVWRAPERAVSAPSWSGASEIIDVLGFGEIGLVARRRSGGKPTPLALGPITAPGSPTNAPAVVDLGRSEAGTLTLRGSMVPRHPFPPGTERSEAARLAIAADGFVDTFYPCRLDRDTKALTLNGPPAGIVSVGGYRFVLKEMQETIAGVEEGGSVATFPDALAGHRLGGTGTDRARLRRMLAELGANPLLVAAFRERRSGERATAA